VKFELGQEIVARFHNPAAAEAAQREFIARVSEKAVPTDLEAKVIRVDEAGLRIANVLKEAGLAASTSEANRKIDEGAVKVDGVRVSDRGSVFKAGADHVFQLGSRRFARVRFELKA
jgi:tyrosyl-tRNA synthetase